MEFIFLDAHDGLVAVFVECPGNFFELSFYQTEVLDNALYTCL